MTDIIFYKDTNKPLELNYKDENGTIIDLSGSTATAKFYDKENGSLLLSLSNGAGITLAATAPNISIAFTVNQINSLPRKGLIKVEKTTSGVTERVITENFAILF